jgi:hypothetical protein
MRVGGWEERELLKKGGSKGLGLIFIFISALISRLEEPIDD